MVYGTVKWFSPAKGYGFIKPDEGGEDCFMHFSSIHMEGFRTLQPGTRVSFELLSGPKGVLAENIVPISDKVNELGDTQTGLVEDAANAATMQASQSPMQQVQQA